MLQHDGQYLCHVKFNYYYGSDINFEREPGLQEDFLCTRTP